jgi:chromosome segregation ATPase
MEDSESRPGARLQQLRWFRGLYLAVFFNPITELTRASGRGDSSMLETFKELAGGGKVQKQAEDLRTLLAAAKEERDALSAMLTQFSIRSVKLAQMDKSLEQVGQRAVEAVALIDTLTARVAALEERLSSLDALYERLAMREATVAGRSRSVGPR